MSLNSMNMLMGRCGVQTASGWNGQHASSSYGSSRTDTQHKSGGRETAMLKRTMQQAQNPVQTKDANGKKVFQSQSAESVVSGSFRYSDSLRTSRNKSKDTALAMKKLHYNFKSLSSKILRSKTSVSAKQAESAARREVLRLKRQKQNGNEDDEELQSAIAHAQAMERVAKKKAKHLLEEEMCKTGGKCMGSLEEKEEGGPEGEDALEEDTLQPKTEELPKEEWEEMPGGDMQDAMEMQTEELQEMMQLLTEQLQAEMETSMEDEMSEMMDEMWEAMEELMEEVGLEDLSEGMGMAPERDMDPADLKMMKIKHRNAEMKEIVKADGEYLKALFDRMEKAKSGGVNGYRAGHAQPAMGSVSFGGFASAEPVSAGFDVSVAGGDIMPDMGASVDISL